MKINIAVSSKFKDLNSVVQDLESYFEEKKKGGMYFPTRWKKLNNMIGGGIQKATINTIGARTGVGKSAFSNVIMWDLADRDNMVMIYLTFEMPAYQQILRHMSSVLNTGINKLVYDDGMRGHLQLYHHSSNFNMFFIEIPFEIDALHPFLQKVNDEIKKQNPLANIVVLVDHTRLFKKDKAKNEEQTIFTLYSTLNYFTSSCKNTFIVLTQLNRNMELFQNTKGDYRSPMISDIFGADAASQFSDTVMFLHRPDMYNINKVPVNIDGNILTIPTKNRMLVEIMKNRHGRCGSCVFESNFEVNNFYEALDLFDGN